MFEDFEISITAEQPPLNGANVTAHWAMGMATGTFSLSTVADAVARIVAAMAEEQPSQIILEDRGTSLFDALFAGRVLEAFRECQTLARTRQNGVRLRIFAELPALMAVPWEYLYDRGQRRWLALDRDLSLVRALPKSSAAPLPVGDALRVLVVIAAPNDLPALDSAREWENLAAVADTSNLELVRVEPTYAALQAALRHGPHVFHFVGHGSFDEGGAGGVLFFRAENGRADPIAADKLAILLSGCETLRLAFLNACQSGQAGTDSAFAGLAQQLIQQGVSAVIAMQTSIHDNHAVRFSHEFYRALADGVNVERAVSEGRKRINEVSCAWGVPALYFQGAEPFAIPRLSDTQKAALLWQKAGRLDKGAAPARIRTLIEAVLKLDPAHAEARNALEQITNAEEAARLYAAAEAQYQNQQWREVHRTLERVERLAPNYLQTRLLWAEVLGRLGDAPLASTHDDAEQEHQYQLVLKPLSMPSSRAAWSPSWGST